MRVHAAAIAVCALAAVPAAAAAHVPIPAEEPRAAPVRQALEPPLAPTPEADCGPGSRPEGEVQGRVPRSDHESGLAAEG